MVSRRLGIVFGGGGTVGMAYHAGITRALERVAGIRPADADLLVGTSAGSVIAAYLRSGWTGEDFWAFALGTHPTLADLDDDDVGRRRRAQLDQPRPGRQVRVRPHHRRGTHGLRTGGRPRSHSPTRAPGTHAGAVTRNRIRPPPGRRGAAHPADRRRARRARRQPHAPRRRRGDRPGVLRRRRSSVGDQPLQGRARGLTVIYWPAVADAEDD